MFFSSKWEAFSICHASPRSLLKIAKAATTPPVPLTLQQKFIKLREAVPSITQKAHSDGVKYKFAKIFDVYQLLTPAMNEFGVNFDIVGEQATRGEGRRLAGRPGAAVVQPAACQRVSNQP